MDPTAQSEDEELWNQRKALLRAEAFRRRIAMVLSAWVAGFVLILGTSFYWSSFNPDRWPYAIGGFAIAIGLLAWTGFLYNTRNNGRRNLIHYGSLRNASEARSLIIREDRSAEENAYLRQALAESENEFSRLETAYRNLQHRYQAEQIRRYEAEQELKKRDVVDGDES